MLPTELEAQLEYYRSQHRTLGCKVTHLFGVPMIALAFPLLFINLRRAFAMFVAGWILQFIGHVVFEKNKPVLFSEARNPLIPLAALIVIGQLWTRILTGQSIEEPHSNNGRLLPRRRTEGIIRP